MEAEPRIILDGDKEAAAQYIRFGLVKLAELRHRMNLPKMMGNDGLFQLQDTFALPDGGNVYVNVVGALSQVRIFMPLEEGEEDLLLQRGPYVVIKIDGQIGDPAVLGETHIQSIVTVFDIPTNSVAENIPRNDEYGGGYCVFPCDWDEIADWWIRSPEMHVKVDVSPVDAILFTHCPPPPRTLNQDYTCYDVDGVEQTYRNTFVEDDNEPFPVPECSDYDWWRTLDYNEHVMTPPSTAPITPVQQIWFQSYKVMYNQTPVSDPGAAFISSSSKSQHASGRNEEDVTQICIWDSDDPPNLIGRTVKKVGTDYEFNQTIYTTPLGVASHRIEGNMNGTWFKNHYVPSEDYEIAEWDNTLPFSGDTSGQFPTGLANWGVGDIQILRDKLTQDEIDWLITNYPLPDPPFYQMPTNMLNYVTDSDYMLQYYISRFSYATYRGDSTDPGCYTDIVWTNDIPSDSFTGYPNDYVDIFAAVGKISDFQTFDFRAQQRNNVLETTILNTIGEMKNRLRPHLVWDNQNNYMAYLPKLYLVGIDETRIPV